MDDNRYQFLWQELSNLNWEQSLVIYNRCGEVSVDDLEKTTPFTRGTAYNRLVSGMNRLRLEGTSPPEDYCHVLYAMVGELGDSPDWKKWPPKFVSQEQLQQNNKLIPPSSSLQSERSQTSPSLSQSEDTQDVRTGAQREQVSQNEPVRRRIIPNVILAILVLGLIFGAFLIGRFLNTGIGPQNANLRNSPEPITAVDSIATDEANEAAQKAVEGTVTVEAATETAIALNVTPDVARTEMAFQAAVDEELTAIAITEAAKATDTPTLTPTPSSTPTNSPTPTPTQMPTVAPEPGTVLFFDDFESGFNEEVWERVSGNPYTANGRLISNNGIWIVTDVGWPVRPH